MPNRVRLAFALLFVLCFSSSLTAQQAPAVTASTAAGKLRFISSAGVCQMRVQILSPAGEPVFDSSWNDGNVFDWTIDSASQALTSGSYRCRVMVKDLDGQVSEKEGTLVAEGGRVSIEPRAGADGIAIVGAEENGPKVTLVIHDGTNGSIVSTSGDLSFRFGNFPAGKDTEQMRLTAQGELDVDGVIRANQGIMFPDGTILTTAAGLPGGKTAGPTPGDGIVRRGATPPPNGAGATVNPGPVAPLRSPSVAAKRLTPQPNFVPAFQFVVGDAGVTVGTTNPAYKLDVAGPINTTTQYNIDGLPFAHNYGTQNAFLGVNAGNLGITGWGNTGVGNEALLSSVNGNYNTATGFEALYTDAAGSYNAAGGALALSTNTTGSYNTANGAGALAYNTTGWHNTATGYAALTSNGAANDNTADGYEALYSNQGSSNTATGFKALISNSSGSDNTAAGYDALLSNNIGSQNTAVGFETLYANTTAINNTAIGIYALDSVTTGNENTAVGAASGAVIVTGHDNVDIANVGGSAGESSTIRIGDSNYQTRAFIAGIRGVTTAFSAVPVLIDSNGQLGTASSSRRFKFDIRDMAEATDGMMRLRPVTFRYLAHGDDAPLQYGLIAEEVADVYPELVTRDKDGQVESVMYQFLAPMLLNEVQKQQRQIDQQQKTIDALARRLDALEKEGRHSSD